MSVSREIDAPVETVFELVTDLPRMGEWSPEATGGRWTGDPAGPARGARFVGHNRNGWRRWSTKATVVEHTPSSTFAFDITSGPLAVARWRYDVEQAGAAGCVVTETWEDHRPRWFAPLTGFLTGVRDRAARNSQNMAATLEALAGAAESRS